MCKGKGGTCRNKNCKNGHTTFRCPRCKGTGRTESAAEREARQANQNAWGDALSNMAGADGQGGPTPNSSHPEAHLGFPSDFSRKDTVGAHGSPIEAFKDERGMSYQPFRDFYNYHIRHREAKVMQPKNWYNS